MDINIPWKLEKLSIKELYELMFKLQSKVATLDLTDKRDRKLCNQLYKHIHSCSFQIGYNEALNKFYKYGIHYIHSIIESKEVF